MCVCIWERNMEKKYLASKRLVPSFSVQRQLLLYGYFKESGSRTQHKSPWQYKIEQADWSILCKLLAGTEMTKLSQSPGSPEDEILCTVKARDEGWSQNVL